MEEGLPRMRRRYTSGRLLEGDLAPDPFDEFRAWLHDAVTMGMAEPNAMVLGTTSADGRPSSRTVLLKGIDDGAFVFFTNTGSRKATEIAANPWVSLCFPWIAMERQVLVCGAASAVSREATLAYWLTRPRESQIGAWASHQSAVIGTRADLEAAAAAVGERFPDEVPLPDFWSGYRVVPDTVEFWQGGVARLHDRLRYRRASGGPDDAWVVERLAP
ncbi:pyridoxamine 5'-phosphate oxidase [Jiangella sp. DSM 45060]|uniref:pyridoxamine 5'-phosphate oxidase n=1 Tax=Jiangella sp. DSM 45060 TaxID=1798224 RepID=UPI001E4D825F|nr:pyridoxamine 5'-phosphate oxidase [Jiangella sp. DSM 45060]